MAKQRSSTIAEYIKSAPPAGQSHLRKVYALLKKVAPKAEHVIKWNTPFFIEPRFLFAFSAHKAHLSIMVLPTGVESFRKELSAYEITKAGLIKIRYDQALPEALIGKIAKARLRTVSARKDDSFW